MRVTNAVPRRKRVKRTLKAARGYRGSRSKNYRNAKRTVDKALMYAYFHRRKKKRDFRSLWIVRINAAARECGADRHSLRDRVDRHHEHDERHLPGVLTANRPKFQFMVAEQLACHEHEQDAQVRSDQRRETAELCSFRQQAEARSQHQPGGQRIRVGNDAWRHAADERERNRPQSGGQRRDQSEQEDLDHRWQVTQRTIPRRRTTKPVATLVTRAMLTGPARS